LKLVIVINYLKLKVNLSLLQLKREIQRLEQEKPVLDAFWLWVEANADLCLPKSKLGAAMNYAINQKDGLMTYLEDENYSISSKRFNIWCIDKNKTCEGASFPTQVFCYPFFNLH
jgi:hypothetical protein